MERPFAWAPMYHVGPATWAAPDPAQITRDAPIVSGAGKQDPAGDLYYDSIKFRAEPWSFSGVGFYPWLPGEEVATTLSWERLKLTSFDIGRATSAEG